MDTEMENAIENHETSSGFTKINFKNLDLLIRERVFEFVACKKTKYLLLLDHVCGNLDKYEYDRLKISDRNVGDPEPDCQHIYVYNNQLTKDVKLNNGHIRTVTLTEDDFYVAKCYLSIADVKPGIISKMSKYMVFHHRKLKIRSSTLRRSELRLLFGKNAILDLDVENLKVLLDEGNKEIEYFKLLLEAFTNLTSDDQVKFTLRIPELPYYWLKLLLKCRCKFSKITITVLATEDPIQAGSELLHRFVTAQEKGFELMFNVDTFRPYSDFDSGFYTYFKKVEKPDASGADRLVGYKSFGPGLKDMYFVPIKRA